MSRLPAFWDSSALVPLCTDEPTTSHARSLSDQLLPVVWWGTSVEVHSAIARTHRSGKLKEPGRQEAIARLFILTHIWLEIPPSAELREQAKSLLDRHALSAANSLQLAAALSWCKGRTSGRTFICSDMRLSDAASREGFLVVQP